MGKQKKPSSNQNAVKSAVAGKQPVSKFESNPNKPVTANDGSFPVVATVELRRQLEQVLNENRSFDGLEFTTEFPKIGRRTFLLNGRCLDREQGLPGMILLAMQEVNNVEE